MSFRAGIEFYKLFLAMSNHFNDSSQYDISKYGYSVKVNDKTFAKAKFRWQFQSLYKKQKLSEEQIKLDFYSAFKSVDFGYINPFTFVTVVNKQQSCNSDDMKDVILSEITTIIENNLLCETDDLYPTVYRMYKDKVISLETLLVVNKYIKTILTEANSRDILVWPNMIRWLENKAVVILPLLEDDQFIDQIQAIASQTTKET